MTATGSKTSIPAPVSRIGRLKERITGFPRSIWVLAAAVLVLWTGRGMVIPFIIIYFSQIIGLPGTMVGSGIAVSSLIGIALVMITAGQIDRRGGKPILVVAVSIIAIATAGLAWATTTGTYLAAVLVLYVAGQSYWPSVDTVTSSLAEQGRVITAMSVIRVAMTMGLGTGSFIGGLIVSGGGLTDYRLMFMLGAGLMGVAALLIWWLVPDAHPVSRSEDGEAGRGSWREVLADRTFLYSMVLLFTLVLGFTQVQMSIPPFLRAQAGIPEGFIGSLFFMNTLVVILAQVPVAARVDRGNAGTSLALAALLWTVSFSIMMLTVEIQQAAVLVFLFFIAGELVFMPVSAIFAVRLAPDRLRGRYFSMLSMTWGGSFAIATFTAGAVQDTSRPILLWPVLAALMVFCATGALRLRNVERLQPAAEPPETAPDSDPPAEPEASGSVAPVPTGSRTQADGVASPAEQRHTGD